MGKNGSYCIGQEQRERDGKRGRLREDKRKRGKGKWERVREKEIRVKETLEANIPFKGIPQLA